MNIKLNKDSLSFTHTNNTLIVSVNTYLFSIKNLKFCFKKSWPCVRSSRKWTQRSLNKETSSAPPNDLCRMSMSLTLKSSFNVAESHSLAASHQIVLQVVWISPWRICIIVFIIWFNFLQFFLLLVVHPHQLYPGLLIDSWFSYWCSWASLRQFYDYFSLLVFSSVRVQQFITEKLLACPPHRGIFGIEVLNIIIFTSIWFVFTFSQMYSPLKMALAGSHSPKPSKFGYAIISAAFNSSQTSLSTKSIVLYF